MIQIDNVSHIIDVPQQFKPQINVVYPPNNNIEFERWFDINFNNHPTDRWYLPIYWTGYYVNNNYGNDRQALARLQEYLNGLDRSKKYFTIIQYDDAILNDVSHLDLCQFNMSKPYDYPLPLIGMPHPYVFNEEKKYLANFIGNITHQIRNHAKTLQGKDGYYISFDRHSPEEYCRIIAQSHFTLCYRGYGINSFRIAEALKYGSIPVYISDEFMQPHNLPLIGYCVNIHQSDMSKTDEWLREINGNKEYLLVNGKSVYEKAFTYEGTKNKILNHLKNI